MKKNFLFFGLCFLIFTQGATAQSETQAVKETRPSRFWEAGMSVYRLDFLPERYYSSYAPVNKPYESSFFRGLQLKYYFGLNALRSAVDYQKKEGIPSYYGTSPESRTGSIHLGYQRLFIKGRFSPYVFNDFGFGYSQLKGYSSCYNCFGPLESGEMFILPVTEGSYKVNTTTWSLSQGFGIRYNPFKSVVISAETYFQYALSFEKYSHNPSRRFDSWRFSNHPLQVSLGFIF